MARYYGSEALRNKKPQDKVDDYVVEKGKKFAKRQSAQEWKICLQKSSPKRRTKPIGKTLETQIPISLHYKVVDFIRRFYPDALLIAGLGKTKIRRTRD